MGYLIYISCDLASYFEHYLGVIDHIHVSGIMVSSDAAEGHFVVF